MRTPSLILLSCLLASADALLQELTTAQDAVLLTKKEEVSVILLLGVEPSEKAHLPVLEEVAERITKSPVLAYSSMPELWERYEMKKPTPDQAVVLLFRCVYIYHSFSNS